MRAGIFVTGTDTGVGKTVVAAALAVALYRRGYRVGVMKPVESGCSRIDGGLDAQDARLLREASQCRSAQEDVNPYALAEPLAPALAAELGGVIIDVERIARALHRIGASHDVVIVEGAGGLLTPLAPSLTMRDLARTLHLPLVVVVRNVLGAINHAALTVEAASRAGLEILGLVLNSTAADDDLASASNAESLRRWAGAPLIGQVSYIPSCTTDAMAVTGERLLQDGFRQFGRFLQADGASVGPIGIGDKIGS